MKHLLPILCLFIFSCDSGGGEVHGCADSQACNYNPETTIDNNSCEYAQEYYDCDGNCIFNDPISFLTGYGGCIDFEATLYDDGITNNTIIKFTEELDLTQFTILPLPSIGSNIVKISNPEIFGVDCALYYDFNYKILSGYSVTAVEYPEGTGESCNPNYINNILSISGQSLSLDFNIPYDGSNNLVPNPYFWNSAYSETPINQQVRFFNLPSSCTIKVKTALDEELISMECLDAQDENLFWNFSDSNDSYVNSGIYLYEILVNDEIIYRNSIIAIIP